MNNQKRKSYVCERCGSADVRQNCDAEFDETAQKWVIVAFFDSFSCETCGCECRIKETSLP